jgi:Zn-dependent peptidase ImmA (M78 family)
MKPFGGIRGNGLAIKVKTMIDYENNFKIQVVKNDEIDAFGAYVSPSIKKNDFGVVLFNLEANLIASIEEKDISFKEMFIETIMHEIGHALEEFYDLEFDEDRIERIAESYRVKYSTENEL